MKTRITGLGLGMCLVLLPLLASGQPAPNFTAHYPAGVEGIKGGSLPPPGFYIRDYNLFYYANKLEVKNGPPGYDVFAYVNAPRAIWISKYKLLGGYYGADVLLPIGLVEQDDSIGVVKDKGGVGDVFVEPITLSWHPKQWDLGVGYGFWAPTGDHDSGPQYPSLIWKSYWTHMLTAGATYYLDTNKTWAVSLLNRYEINHDYEEAGMDITPGQAYTLEWGISKSLTPTIEAGLIGYLQQQTTKDCGSGASDVRDHVFSIGPEINTFCPKCKLFTSLRYAYEFEARDRPEGHLWTLTLTKLF
jgi:hypothetical protein